MRYPGGKKKLIPTLERYFLGKRVYIDPFAGGLSIPTAIRFDAYYLNDLNPGIAALLWCCKEQDPRLLEEIQRYQPKIQDFYSSKEFLLNFAGNPRDPEHRLNLAMQKLIVHQFSHSGLGEKAGSPIGGHQQNSAWTFDCRWSPGKIVADLKALYARNIVAVGNLHYRDFIRQHLDVIQRHTDDVVIYLDPPYYHQGEALYSKALTKPQHQDFIEFCNEIVRYGVTTVISSDENPLTDQLSSTYLSTKVDNTSSIPGKRTSNSIKKEVIYVAHYRPNEPQRSFVL